VTFDAWMGGSIVGPWQMQPAWRCTLFFLCLDQEAYAQAVGPNGLAAVYHGLFGDPGRPRPHPRQPGDPRLPFKLAPGLSPVDRIPAWGKQIRCHNPGSGRNWRLHAQTGLHWRWPGVVARSELATVLRTWTVIVMTWAGCCLFPPGD
jgi:hypothetical protein